MRGEMELVKAEQKELVREFLEPLPPDYDTTTFEKEVWKLEHATHILWEERRNGITTRLACLDCGTEAP